MSVYRSKFFILSLIYKKASLVFCVFLFIISCRMHDRLESSRAERSVMK
jgi:hypothetical protein